MNFEEKPTFSPYKKREKVVTEKKFPIAYVIVGIVAIVGIILLVFFLNRGTILPNMIGWTESDASLWANENSILVRSETEFSDTVPSGEVMEQSPTEGEELKGGNFVELVISGGPDLSTMVTVPDIKNMTMAEVENWAADNHMTKVRITSEESETVEAGKVISFTINDNTVLDEEIRRDTPLYVTFSKGKSAGKPVTVPDFSTMTVDAANVFGEENGIIIEIAEEFSETYPKGQIYKQSIKAEEVVNSGDTIKLSVSKGKEILVPNFYQYTKDAAAVKASQLGISILTKERYSSSNKDVLISQSISSGTLYNEGDIVELTYSLGNSFDLSSFVGQSLDSLNSWVKPLNELGANLKVVTTYTASDKSAGTILSQDKANVSIGIGSTINVIVSEGGVIFVPDLVADLGKPYAEITTREKAIAICDELNLVPVFTAEHSEGRLPGEVWYQSIEPGTEVNQQTTIQLKYVPISNTYSVPDFTGLSETDVRNLGYDKQFTIKFVDGGYEENMIDKVISQSTTAGSVVAPGTAITLTIGTEDLSPPITDGTAGDGTGGDGSTNGTEAGDSTTIDPNIPTG